MNAFSEDQMIIVCKYLSGEATPDEAIRLHAWLKDETFQQEFRGIRNVWLHLSKDSTDHDFNTLAAWREMEEFLSTGRQVKQKKRNHYLAAACLALAVVALGGILINQAKEIAAEVPEKVVNVTTVSMNRTLRDTLADGSFFTLNQNSKLQYASSFYHSNRHLRLNGEAYFAVVPDKSKPFVVSVDDLKIEVVGTSFNVMDDSSAGRVIVQVTSGIVKLSNAVQELLVKKGQTGIYQKKTRDFLLLETVDINSLGYATGSFSFKNLSLTQVAAYLQKAFHVDIVFSTAQLSSCSLTAEFINKPLPYILDVIAATLNVRYRQEGKKVIISGEPCN